MSEQLFKKAIVFTDIHFGAKQNNQQHNDDCLNFVKWMIEEGKTWGADTCIFTGDFHNQRNTLHVGTMNYSLTALELISGAFKQFWFIPGNHDLFYREKRDLNSIEWARNIKNLQIINDFVTVGDVTFAPWLVDDEHKKIPHIKSRYMFGHFELPHFYMNKMIQMPDNGNANDIKDFKKQEYVFSGHFHKRQVRENVVYMGNCFPHNFSDAWDDERGMMFLEWGKEPFFKNWDMAPKYHTLKLSQLLETPEKFIDDRTFAKVDIDFEISFEEASVIKETLTEHYGARKIELIQSSRSIEEQEFDGEVEFRSIDQLVIEGLKSFESELINKDKLVDIYLNL
jgi:DNA repair exonuclease SbcCD nuclease subunit